LHFFKLLSKSHWSRLTSLTCSIRYRIQGNICWFRLFVCG